MTATRISPWQLAAVLALAWLAFAPPTPDLAAQVYRSGLFEREGWTVFDVSWYGGHHMPGYSLLFPPLAAVLGVRVVGALAAVASAVLFERIARRHFGDRGRAGALLFGAGTVADLLIGRLTFALGMAVALGAVLALQRGRRRVGLALAVTCTLASPVAGLFLALAGIGHWLAVRQRPPLGLWLAVAAFTPAAALALLFPEGGSQPFAAVAFAAVALSCALLLWLLPASERVLRSAVLVYLGAALLAFAVASPMGGNASRLGVAFAAPLLVCAAAGSAGRHRRLVVAATIPLLAWQWWAPVRETVKGAVDPSARLAYFAPLLAFLEDRADAAPMRVEVPFTRLHWEAVHVARRVSLARGWETQLDVKYNALFRAGETRPLTPARYRAWLRREGVHYVALPDVALDPTGRAEAALVRAGLPFLRPVFSDRHWDVFEVRGTPGLTDGAGRLTQIGTQSFALRARKPGTTLVRVRYTPYWRVSRGRGCVARAPGGWTAVRAAHAGTIAVEAAFDPRRILAREPRCSNGRAPPGS